MRIEATPSRLEHASLTRTELHEPNQEFAALLSTAKKNQDKTSPSFNVQHMSINEFMHMQHELYESGQISIEEYLDMSADRTLFELSHHNLDEPLNWIELYEDLIIAMKSFPESVGIERTERSLAILKSVDAKAQKTIPTSV